MPVCDAQLTSVSKVRHLVSDLEINAILRVVQESRLPAYTSSAEEDVDVDGKPIHTTTYLQTDNIFETELRWLHRRLLKVVRRMNKINKWGLDANGSSSLNIRVSEYHEMRVGGALRNPQHYGIGSMVTVDIMLQEATEGAVFQTLETTVQNHADPSNVYLRNHPFAAGDALVFVSHKYHCVSPLTEGSRKVLVVEFWTGKKRHCGHRCDLPFEECTFVDCS